MLSGADGQGIRILTTGVNEGKQTGGTVEEAVLTSRELRNNCVRNVDFSLGLGAMGWEELDILRV